MKRSSCKACLLRFREVAGYLSVKRDGGAALDRISQALYGLVDSLLNSLEEFRDVVHTLEQETAAGSPELPQINSVSDGAARPELLLVVAGASKELVRTSVSDIKANVHVQKLMPAIQTASVAEHHTAFFQDSLKIPKHQQSCSGQAISSSCEETLVCIPSKGSRVAKRSAGKGRVICKHFCEHHAEVMDPSLWRNLPQELVEIIFARLPLPRIVELCDSSKAWYMMSKSSANFKQACSESNPALFGLLGWNVHYEAMWTSLHVKSKEWLFVELASPPVSVTYERWEPESYTDLDAYNNSVYACDGGLVDFVPQEHLISLPVLLLTEGDRNRYRVILVRRVQNGGAYLAHFYDSRTGVWKTMDSGLVYGASSELIGGHGIPYVIDCTTKTVFDLSYSPALASIADVLAYSMAEDHLIVLYESDVSGQHNGIMYLVSEYVWEISKSDLRELNVTESPVHINKIRTST